MIMIVLFMLVSLTAKISTRRRLLHGRRLLAALRTANFRLGGAGFSGFEDGAKRRCVIHNPFRPIKIQDGSRPISKLYNRGNLSLGYSLEFLVANKMALYSFGFDFDHFMFLQLLPLVGVGGLFKIPCAGWFSRVLRADSNWRHTQPAY